LELRFIAKHQEELNKATTDAAMLAKGARIAPAPVSAPITDIFVIIFIVIFSCFNDV
jgi:hypothetical protein